MKPGENTIRALLTGGSYAVQTSPISIHNHTMQEAVLQTYVTNTKFFDEQSQLLLEAISNKWKIEVHGCYESFAGTLFKHLDYRVERGPISRQFPQKKRYNYRRPVMYCCKNRLDELVLVLLTFPSKEYVEQFAQIVATYCSIQGQRLGGNPESTITRYHYKEMEDQVPDWTGLREALEVDKLLPGGSHVILGEVDPIEQVLQDNDFSQPVSIPFGIDFNYELRGFPSKDKTRRIYTLAVGFSFWGTASGLIARSLVVDGGARHIIYVAKAGTTISSKNIHEPFCPDKYLLLKGDGGPWDVAQCSVPSPIRDRTGLVRDIQTGAHITVPTVMGETTEQHEQIKRYGAVTVDNEISHMAFAIHRLNDSGFDAEFTALHFITDYLHDKSRPEISGPPASDLTIHSPEYYQKKKEVFEKIGRHINNYACLTPATFVSRAQDFKALTYEIREVIDNWQTVVSVIRNHGAALRKDHRLIPLLLKLRLGAFYNNDLVDATTLLRRTFRAFVHDNIALDIILQYAEAMTEYYSLAASTIQAAQEVHLHMIATTLRGLGQASERRKFASPAEEKYILACCLIGSVEVLQGLDLTESDCEEALASLKQAEEYLSEANLTEADQRLEKLHADTIKARIMKTNKLPAEGRISLLRSIVDRWSIIKKGTEFRTTSASVFTIRAAASQVELLHATESLEAADTARLRNEVEDAVRRLKTRYPLFCDFISDGMSILKKQ